MSGKAVLAPTDGFVHRHIGPREEDLAAMLERVGYGSLDQLSAAVIPAPVQTSRPLALGEPLGEREALERLRVLAQQNRVFRSYIGLGYHGTVTPPVIQRNVLENPGWYTQYTPYQAEISQGRLEALLNFQTLIADLTGLPVANASLLDEATAAAEAMAMCFAAAKGQANGFFAAADCHPQTLAVLATRAQPLGIALHVGDPADTDFAALDLAGALLQYPTTDGRIEDYRPVIARAQQAGARVVMATDPLALTLLAPPGALGADIAVGSAQRFGVPPGYGGPHAAYLAAGEKLARLIPGRLVGVSKDHHGRRAYRLSLQTREQHIRREKATSNICTAQVLLAVMASMYAVYHGPEGLAAIARRVRGLTRALARGLERLGHSVGDRPFFDTLRVHLGGGLTADRVHPAAREREINLRPYDDGTVGVALDETVGEADLRDLLAVFAGGTDPGLDPVELAAGLERDELPAPHRREGAILTHPVFHRHRSEHEMLRYLKQLENRDLSLAQSMIPLGSCTMKLNATSEMIPIGWPQLAQLHPFAPADQAQGYARMMDDLDRWLSEITGFAKVSLQPNAGSQGEYAGLLVIRAYQHSQGQGQRDVCLIPTSAHGTNPASAVMAGLKVVPVACDVQGNVDLADLAAKADLHRDRLSALMITYPSTHGVFERDVRQICRIVHERGGQVYMDGANMNAQVGLCRPGEIGADVCHLNLHKTFCIPHGGGGPGVGPIGVAAHLAPFLPGHPLSATGGEQALGPVAAAPFGSAGILPISWMYIAMMGASGLKRASQVAILAANYMARCLAGHYQVVYTGENGLVAHEFILDCRPFRDSAGITVDDIAKRLMDYGFHAPTMSFPVAGTLMVEPTESEPKAELDRLVDALIAIREEIRAIEEGRADREDNALKHAPHTARAIAADDWSHRYGREQAAFPAPWVVENKFWPAVGRIDNAWGDRHLVCVCPPITSY
jgi:glycine dehydrogenase